MQETQVWFLGQEDPKEEGTATHSSILAWRIPWTEEPGGQQFIRSQRVGHDWVTKHNTQHTPLYIFIFLNNLCSQVLYCSLDLFLLPLYRKLSFCGRELSHIFKFDSNILLLFSCNMSLWKMKKWKSLSHVWLFVNPWTIAHQAPLSMGFSRQEHWSVLAFPSPEDLPNPRMEPRSPALQADSLPAEPQGIFA